MIYDIVPCPKPRMTKRDKWLKRAPTSRYWVFKDLVQLLMKGVSLDGATVVFYLPMPKSWSTRRRLKHNQAKHRQKPDLDNLIKALGDALYDDDSHVASITASKRWAERGAIEILPGAQE